MNEQARQAMGRTDWVFSYGETKRLESHFTAPLNEVWMFCL